MNLTLTSLQWRVTLNYLKEVVYRLNVVVELHIVENSRRVLLSKSAKRITYLIDLKSFSNFILFW